MKCPYCKGSVSLFSKEMNRFGKDGKRCPQCQRPVRLFMSLKVAALLFVPAFFLAFVLDPIFVGVGLPGSLAVGLVGGVMVMLAFRLKAIEKA